MVWGHLPSRTRIHSNFYQFRLPLHRSHTPTSSQSKQRTLPTPRLSTSLAIFFSLLFCVQWILLTFGAHRMAQIPLFSPASGATSSCTFTSPPVALERVMHTYSGMANTNEEQKEEGHSHAYSEKRRALMPPGFGIGDAYGSSLGDARLVIFICAYCKLYLLPLSYAPSHSNLGLIQYFI